MRMPSDLVAAFAPGRVNLIGEHTDYNAGLALPFATAAGITVQGRVLSDPRRFEVRALDLGEDDSFGIDVSEPGEGWRAYVRGAVGELQRAGLPLRGARLEIRGDLPRGSGLSSSAALEVAVCLAAAELADAASQLPGPAELARICSRIEHRWAGSQSGLLDQLASLCGADGEAVLIDFRSLAMRHVPLVLDDHRLVTLDSGEAHANATSGYNERREQCEQACELLGVSSLRDAGLDAAAGLPGPLPRRVRHVICENERVEQAVAALERRDWAALGRLLDASHASLRDCYEVSTPAVEEAVARLKAAGALGARLIGGGFGGHVLGLLPPDVDLPAGAMEVSPGKGARLL